MKLYTNPFFVLRLPCSSGRKNIITASEELSFILDPDLCSNAQNDLINLGKRLTAEIGWFPELDEEGIKHIQSKIENSEKLSTEGMSQLSRLNATLHNFSISNETDEFEIGYEILDIDEQYSQLDIGKTTSLINQQRKFAKIALVQESDVAKEINKRRDDIKQIITDRLLSLEQEVYIDLVTMVAENCIADKNYEDGAVLADVVDQYEIRMQSELEARKTDIERNIEKIKNLSGQKQTMLWDGRNGDSGISSIDVPIMDEIYKLIELVKSWDIIAQPLQLKSHASGMPHAISEKLGLQLRDLALYLHNENGRTKEALTLVDAMKDVFAELDGLADLFGSDSDTLNNLIQSEKETKEILLEMEALQKQSDSLKIYTPTINVESYIERVKRIDRKIKTVDLEENERTNIRESLCYLARATAIDLHNTKQKTKEALDIVKALAVEFGDMPSLKIKLNADVETLTQQWILSISGNKPSYSYNTTRSNSNSNSNSSSSGIGCWVAIAIIILIVVIAAFAGGRSSSDKSSSYSQNTSVETYTVTLDNSNGSGGTSSISVKNGSPMPYATAPFRSGYVFKGYYSLSNGKGVKYYDSLMNSVHKWDKDHDGTLYAYWMMDLTTTEKSSDTEESYDLISLSKANFENYFILTTDAEFIDDEVTITYSISPKNETYAINSNSSEQIEVKIGVVVSELSFYYGDPNYNKTQAVTLYKSQNYSISGSFSFVYSSFSDTVYWMTGIASCSGKLEK